MRLKVCKIENTIIIINSNKNRKHKVNRLRKCDYNTRFISK